MQEYLKWKVIEAECEICKTSIIFELNLELLTTLLGDFMKKTCLT